MSNIIDKLKNHYQEISLNEKQIKKLKSLKQEHRPIFQMKYLIATAASLVLCLYILLPKTSTLEKIANEVIYNHQKNLPSEFLVDQMSELNTRLTKLDFKVINSDSLALNEVIGGRYCSIQGLTAAQIKIKSGGKTATLYQSNFKDLDESKLPYEISKDGITVKIWMEAGILHAQAKND